MRRRTFLIRSSMSGLGLLGVASITTLGGALVTGCGEDGEGGADGGGDPIFAVESASGHSHTFTIPESVLDAPPPAGFTASTSRNSGHTHTITLSQADLADIAASISAMGNTTLNSGHFHAYDFAVEAMAGTV